MGNGLLMFDDDADDRLNLQDILKSMNVADMLDDDDLTEIGTLVKNNYDEDEDSRSEWVDRYEEAMKVATQVYEKKDSPWPDASNVRFPLITVGALQFHARAYPALLPSKGLVQIGTIGIDVDGTKDLKATVIGAHMNYQFVYEMDNWEEDMDRLLIMLPVTGCEFKKTYFDPNKGYNCSEHVPATDLCINYYAKSIEEAERKTHILKLNGNEIIEYQRLGMYSNVSLGNPVVDESKTDKIFDQSIGMKPPTVDTSTPYKILEWHGFLDLDGDNYKEPYIVTIDYKSGKVLRIVARFRAENVKVNQNGEIFKIEPTEYFTKYDFVPNPAGGIYGIGFGTLLGPINHSVNTLINQLVDAGTLSNRQSGFISRNLRMKNGRLRFAPGEWKEVNASGADLRQGILPLPVREPSTVLFQLLETLINSGERLTSTTDMMVGENPGQNQKATTTQAVLDQGMKVFTAVYKRIRRAMGKEFQKVFVLNHYYLDEDKTAVLFDGTNKITRDMYDLTGMIVAPTADPNVATTNEKQTQAQALLSMMQLGGFNEYEIKRLALEALDIANPDKYLIPPEQMPPPPPDPKMVQLQMEQNQNQFDNQMKVADFTHKMDKDQKDMEIKQEDAITNRLAAMAKALSFGSRAASDASKAAVQAYTQKMRATTSGQSQ